MGFRILESAITSLRAEVTHNHPEGIKGAQAVAGAVFLARTGHSKEEIRSFLTERFYALDFTLDGIRPFYSFDVTCRGSCPQALEAFLESEDFEDAIRLALSLGGDSDTIAAMTGAVAEAYYGIPDRWKEEAFSVLRSGCGPDGERFDCLEAEIHRFLSRTGRSE